MSEDSVLLHYRDGHTVRCSMAGELDPGGSSIRVQTANGEDAVDLSELKAIFFLRERPVEEDAPPHEGSLLAVEFDDGEVIRGRSAGYTPEKSGFFLFPLDRSKNEKIFVINTAVVSIDVEKL